MAEKKAAAAKSKKAPLAEKNQAKLKAASQAKSAPKAAARVSAPSVAVTPPPAAHTAERQVPPQRLTQTYNPLSMMQSFLNHEAAGGALMLMCALLALMVANSGLNDTYQNILYQTKAVVGVGSVVVEQSVIQWINNGLMALFFFLAGLEIKREMLEGSLSQPKQAALPVLAAIGGIVVPAVIFVLFNLWAGEFLKGWAIPTATDIAFSLGILVVLGKRVPVALKVFLLALAAADDLGAALITAVAYTSHLNVLNLGAALLCGAALWGLNRANIVRGSLYLLVGSLLWLCMMKSGIHAALTGCIVAAAIPLNVEGQRRSLLRQLETDLNPFVAFVVLPLFAFANAGVPLEGLAGSDTVFSGVVFGLVLGKPLGIMGAVWLALKMGWATLPTGLRREQVAAVSLLGGVGFTMSLFFAGLVFQSMPATLAGAKLGILVGSFLAAALGFAAVWVVTTPRAMKKAEELAEKAEDWRKTEGVRLAQEASTQGKVLLKKAKKWQQNVVKKVKEKA